MRTYAYNYTLGVWKGNAVASQRIIKPQTTSERSRNNPNPSQQICFAGKLKPKKTTEQTTKRTMIGSQNR
eukprot:3260682-Lingulodinium_polyedra.AAC.1